LHGVDFAIFVQALPFTAEGTLCRVGDEAEARRIGSKRPDLPAALPEKQLRLDSQATS
jgi:hypothetical protein